MCAHSSLCVSPVKTDEKISERYQQVMKEWKACEVIVKHREKEVQSAIFAKLSSGSSIDSHVLRLIHRDSTLSNEVGNTRISHTREFKST